MALAPEPLQPAAPETSVGPRVYGVVDVLRADRIAGWAIDRADSAAAVDVEVYREGALVATVRADRLRRDLERGGVGTGRYGFVCDLKPPLDPGFEFTVSAVARTGDGVSCELRRAAAAGGDGNADRRLVERIFELVSRPSETPAAPVAEIERIVDILQRLEVAQARIESALSAVEPPAAPSLTSVKLLLGVSLATAAISLVLGLVSMWQP
jgi:hypothetical protein